MYNQVTGLKYFLLRGTYFWMTPEYLWSQYFWNYSSSLVGKVKEQKCDKSVRCFNCWSKGLHPEWGNSLKFIKQDHCVWLVPSFVFHLVFRELCYKISTKLQTRLGPSDHFNWIHTNNKQYRPTSISPPVYKWGNIQPISVFNQNNDPELLSLSLMTASITPSVPWIKNFNINTMFIRRNVWLAANIFGSWTFG